MTTNVSTQPSAGARPSLPGKPEPGGSGTVVAARLIGGAVALWALLSLIGLAVTHLAGSGALFARDRGVDDWLLRHRTGLWNTLTEFGSGAANTQTAIAVTAIAVLLLRWRLSRWYESWIVVAAITGELLVFLAVTATVHRPRPPVPRLDVSPPTSSFPSGHTAAGVALYGCLAILLLWVYGRRPWTLVLATVLWLVPLMVGASRLYRGMHYPSDVVVGALGGGLWLLIVITTLLPQRGRTRDAVRT